MKRITLYGLTVLLFLITGCTKKSDNYYINEAAKNLSDNNIADAVKAYDKLVDEYPNSPKAPYALFQAATLYQNLKVTGQNLTPEQSFQNAVERFRNLFDKYPDDRLAPKALFMSGFIQSNNLKQYPQATATFNLFLQKFPDNELAYSAKEEIKNMGLTPEEIIQRKANEKPDVSVKQ